MYCHQNAIGERGREREGGGREKGVERGRLWGKGRQRRGGIGKERETWFCWLRCAVRTVAWMVLLAVVLTVWIVDGSAVVGLTLALETTAALLVLSIVVFAVVLH